MQESKGLVAKWLEAALEAERELAEEVAANTNLSVVDILDAYAGELLAKNAQRNMVGTFHYNISKSRENGDYELSSNQAEWLRYVCVVDCCYAFCEQFEGNGREERGNVVVVYMKDNTNARGLITPTYVEQSKLTLIRPNERRANLDQVYKAYWAEVNRLEEERLISN